MFLWGWWKCSGIRWWWLENSVNITENHWMWTLKDRILWYVNYISKLLRKKTGLHILLFRHGILCTHHYYSTNSCLSSFSYPKILSSMKPFWSRSRTRAPSFHISSFPLSHHLYEHLYMNTTYINNSRLVIWHSSIQSNLITVNSSFQATEVFQKRDCFWLIDHYIPRVCVCVCVCVCVWDSVWHRISAH